MQKVAIITAILILVIAVFVFAFAEDPRRWYSGIFLLMISGVLFWNGLRSRSVKD